MTTTQIVEILNLAWDEQGCLGKIRNYKFDPTGFEELLSKLNSVNASDTDIVLDREFVRLLWFIPLFLTWQWERANETETYAPQLEVFVNRFTEVVFKLLGTP